jgi:hypothetical protein
MTATVIAAWIKAELAPSIAVVAIALVSVLAGIGMLWVFARCSNQAAIRKSKNRIRAHLYELRLFSDEPSIVFRAQGRLLVENFRLMWHVLPPVLVLAVPMIVAFVYLDAVFGRAPLRIGEQAIVTVQLKNSLTEATPPPLLEVPSGVAVSSPAVRILRTNEVSWRILPTAQVCDGIRVVTPEGPLVKHIQAGSGGLLRYLSEIRSSSITDLLVHAGELPFSNASVKAIVISYPPATVHWLGIDVHWAVWFFVFSIVAALLLKNRMGVAF